MLKTANIHCMVREAAKKNIFLVARPLNLREEAVSPYLPSHYKNNFLLRLPLFSLRVQMYSTKHCG